MNFSVWCEHVVDALIDLGYNVDYSDLVSSEATATNDSDEMQWLELHFDSEPLEAFESGVEPEEFAQDIVETVEE